MRAELDSDLGVHAWRRSEQAPASAAPVDPDAPSWWFGDEEASAAFVNAQGGATSGGAR